eukprot:COSAG02_NODE_965_length_15584_cov_21.604312_14_plen_89_part_00
MEEEQPGCVGGKRWRTLEAAVERWASDDDCGVAVFFNTLEVVDCGCLVWPLLHEGKLVGLDKLSGHGKSIEDLVALVHQAFEAPGHDS